MGRAAVFIDGGYVDKVSDHFGRLTIDFESFSDAACGEDRRFRTYYYNCPPWQDDPPTDDQRERLSGYHKFRDALASLPRFKVREGRLQKIGDRYRQKGVDIQLAVDVVKLAYTGKIDHVILVTADSDFVPAVRGIDGTGVLTSVYYCPDLSVNQELLQVVDERFRMDEEFLAAHTM